MSLTWGLVAASPCWPPSPSERWRRAAGARLRRPRSTRRAARPRRPSSTPASAPAPRPVAPKAPTGPHHAPVAILMYHVVAAAPPGAPYADLWVPPGRFMQEMRALAHAGYHATTLDAVWRAWHGHGTLPRHPVVISFDDGYQSQSTAARRMLRPARLARRPQSRGQERRPQGRPRARRGARHAARRLGDRRPHADPPRPDHGRRVAAAPRGGGLAPLAAPRVRRARRTSSPTRRAATTRPSRRRSAPRATWARRPRSRARRHARRPLRAAARPRHAADDPRSSWWRGARPRAACEARHARCVAPARRRSCCTARARPASRTSSGGCWRCRPRTCARRAWPCAPAPPALTAADVDAALTDERSVVVAWLMRGTLHLVGRDDYPWLLGLTAPTRLSTNRRRLGQEGVAPDDAERAMAIVERALADDGPLTRSAAGRAHRRRGHPHRGPGHAAPAHARRAARDRRARPAARGRRPRLRARARLARRRAGAELAGAERDAALAELARRYLAAHGPAAPADLAAWSGLPLRDARAGLKAIAPELAERGDDLVDLAAREPAPDAIPARLLAAFDPYLLGWKDRAFAVPARHAKRVHPGGGMLRATATVDGLRRRHLERRGRHGRARALRAPARRREGRAARPTPTTSRARSAPTTSARPS